MKLIFVRFLLVTWLVLTCAISLSSADTNEQLEDVSILLNWKHQFQFAGYIAAKEKGFYKQAGLNVELIEFQHGMNTFEQVLTKQADYGINQSSVYVRDGKIVPTHLLATYFQKSPHVLVTAKHIISPHDLVGETIMISNSYLRQSPLGQLFSHFYINDNNTQFVEQNYKVDDFVDEKVNALAVYSTDEPYAIKQQGVEFNIINPVDYGYDLSVGHLFTSLEQAQQYPEISKKLVDATNKGWAYALAHKNEVISIIYNKYSQEKTLDNLKFEANETEKIMMADSIAIGSVQKGSQQKLINHLKRSGILDEDQTLDGEHDDFLFSPEQLDYLKSKNIIRYCATPNWMPMEGIVHGEHVGFTADIFDSFSYHLPVPLELVETNSWAETLEKAKQRECDLITWANKTASRLAHFNFTSPYYETPIVMVTRVDTLYINDIKSIKDERIGVVRSYATGERLRHQFPGINIIDVESMEEGLALVEKGELFAYVDNLMVMSNSLQQTYNSILKVSARLDFKSGATIATRKDEPLLNDVFELLVNHISESERQAIYNKWLAVNQNTIVDYSFAWKVVAAMLLLSFAYLYYYLRLRRLKNELVILSTTDKLTGLYNRAKIDDIILHEKADVDRYSAKLSLILIDLDYFKAVNDKFGHLTGDQVLKACSAIIKNNIRTTDYAGRWGGEEFLIVCPNIGADAAAELAKKLATIIRESSFEHVGHLTISAGVSECSKNESIEASLNKTDQALYHSKQTGRDKVTQFSEL